MKRLAVLGCLLAVAGCGGGSGRRGPSDGFGAAVWSAGGDALAYVAAIHDRGTTRVYVLRRGGPPLAVSPPRFDAWSPAWSPDGSRLAYAAGPVLSNAYKAAPNDLYIVSADGRRRTQLTHTPADESSPSWSPNGRRLVYVRDQRIFTIGANGSNAHAITTGPDSEPEWSPSGRWIAYVHGRIGTGVLTVVHPDGSGRRLLSDPGVDCPRWSPAGNRIAYREDGIVHVADLAGGLTLAPSLAAADGYSCDYAWSPNGSALVVASLPTNGNWHLQTIDIASFQAHSLATLSYDQTGPELEPAWAPAPMIAIGGDALERLDPRTGSLHVLVSSVRR